MKTTQFQLFSYLALLVGALPTLHGCYTSGFYSPSCGSVGQPTIVEVAFPVTSNATIIKDWGDDQQTNRDMEGRTQSFPASNNTDEGISLRVYNQTMDHILSIQHTYNRPGTYYVAFEIVVYRNLSLDDEDEWCIGYKTSNNFEWFFTIKENSCDDTMIAISTSGGSSRYSLPLFKMDINRMTTTSATATSMVTGFLVFVTPFLLLI